MLVNLRARVQCTGSSRRFHQAVSPWSFYGSTTPTSRGGSETRTGSGPGRGRFSSSSKLASVMSRCSAEPQLHPPWASVRTRAKAIGVAGVPTCSLGGGVMGRQPRQSPARPSRPSLLAGGGRTWEAGLSWWRTHPPAPPDTTEGCNWPAQRAEGAPGESQIPGASVQTQKHPLAAPFRRKCSKLNPGSSHGQERTRPARLFTLHPAPLTPASSCSPPGPLCPCQTLHPSSHLWWEPLGTSAELAQSITSSQPLRWKGGGKPPKGSLGGGGVPLRQGEGWATVCFTVMAVGFFLISPPLLRLVSGPEQRLKQPPSLPISLPNRAPEAKRPLHARLSSAL